MTTEFLHVTIAQLACPWWRHQMETFSTLLAICAGNSPVTCEFPPQRPVTKSFDVFFDLHLDEWFPGWMVPGWKIVPCVRKCKACNKKDTCSDVHNNTNGKNSKQSQQEISTLLGLSSLVVIWMHYSDAKCRKLYNTFTSVPTHGWWCLST